MIVICPQCSATYEFADAMQGKRFRCKACSSVVTITPAEPASPAAAPAPATPAAPAPQTGADRHSRLNRLRALASQDAAATPAAAAAPSAQPAAPAARQTPQPSEPSQAQASQDDGEEVSGAMARLRNKRHHHPAPAPAQTPAPQPVEKKTSPVAPAAAAAKAPATPTILPAAVSPSPKPSKPAAPLDADEEDDALLDFGMGDEAEAEATTVRMSLSSTRSLTDDDIVDFDDMDEIELELPQEAAPAAAATAAAPTPAQAPVVVEYSDEDDADEAEEDGLQAPSLMAFEKEEDEPEAEDDAEDSEDTEDVLAEAGEEADEAEDAEDEDGEEEADDVEETASLRVESISRSSTRSNRANHPNDSGTYIIEELDSVELDTVDDLPELMEQEDEDGDDDGDGDSVLYENDIMEAVVDMESDFTASELEDDAQTPPAAEDGAYEEEEANPEDDELIARTMQEADADNFASVAASLEAEAMASSFTAAPQPAATPARAEEVEEPLSSMEGFSGADELLLGIDGDDGDILSAVPIVTDPRASGRLIRLPSEVKAYCTACYSRYRLPLPYAKRGGLKCGLCMGQVALLTEDEAYPEKPLQADTEADELESGETVVMTAAEEEEPAEIRATDSNPVTLAELASEIGDVEIDKESRPQAPAPHPRPTGATTETVHMNSELIDFGSDSVEESTFFSAGAVVDPRIANPKEMFDRMQRHAEAARNGKGESMVDFDSDFDVLNRNP